MECLERGEYMPESKQKKIVKPLRIVNADLYNMVTTLFFEAQNLHPHDFQADLIEEETGYLLRLSFGEQFRAKEELFITDEEIENKSEKISIFVKETADTCQKVMVKDYFKMMKP